MAKLMHIKVKNSNNKVVTIEIEEFREPIVPDDVHQHIKNNFDFYQGLDIDLKFIKNETILNFLHVYIERLPEHEKVMFWDYLKGEILKIQSGELRKTTPLEDELNRKNKIENAKHLFVIFFALSIVVALVVMVTDCSGTEDSTLSSNPHNDEQVVQDIETENTHEVLIPRSVGGDKGKYYLLDMKKEDDVIYALTKRVGVDTVGFTETETNCTTQKMREIGYGEDTINNIKKTDSSEWFDLQSGSSKSDLANFICRK